MPLPQTFEEIEAAYIVDGVMPPAQAATMAKDAAAHLENAILALTEASTGSAADKLQAALKAKGAVEALDLYAEVVEDSTAEEWLGGLVSALAHVRSVATRAFQDSRTSWLDQVYAESGL
jgi:hypothetical protein